MSTTTADTTLPSTHLALHYTGPNLPLTLKQTPLPAVLPGTVLVHNLSTLIEPSWFTLISTPAPGLHLSTPFIPGGRSIGRIAATSPDSSTLHPGQLVLLEPFIHARDSPSVRFLWGTGVFLSSPEDSAALRLSTGIWRDGTMAEYALAPLENCYALDETRLLGAPASGGLGYSVDELTVLTRYLVAYGGLRSLDLRAGETLLVAPATGGFGSAVVQVAVAMGARVLAASRNREALNKLAAMHPRVSVVQLEGGGGGEEGMADLAKIQALGPVDAYLDISPPAAEESTHVRSCLMAVRTYGRVTLMGLIGKDIAIPYALAVVRSLTIKGQYMYEREDARGLIKLVEAGVLKLGKEGGLEVAGEYGLDQWEEGLKAASDGNQVGKLFVMKS